MDFPIQSFMDEDACFRFLLDLFHPTGLPCPAVKLRTGSPSTAPFENPSSTLAARRADGSSTLGPGPCSRGRMTAPRP